MAILTTVKKGYLLLKTATGYVKLLPRTLASLVSMDDGSTVQTQITNINSSITELNRNIGNKIIYAKRLVLTFLTSEILQTSVTPGISDLSTSQSNYVVILGMQASSGTPYNQVIELQYEIRSNNLLVINARGSGFVNGHVLPVSVAIIESS